MKWCRFFKTASAGMCLVALIVGWAKIGAVGALLVLEGVAAAACYEETLRMQRKLKRIEKRRRTAC